MSCPNCGTPMADDQRYCLECGARGGAARLPFLDILRAGSDVQLVPYGQPLPGARALAPPPPPPGAAGVREGLRVNAGLIAGVGVLLLAMLVGVLIGTSGDDPAPVAATTPPPQVITVSGAAAPAAAAATDTDAAAATDASGGTPAAKKKKASATKKAAAAPAAATSSAVKDLDKLTGAAREKAVEKLGKSIATGGKPPKKDSRPAAGGGDFEEIG